MIRWLIRFVMRWLGRLALLLVLLGVGIWIFGSREAVVTDVHFDAAAFRGDVDAYLERRESGFEDITEGVEKRVIWAKGKGIKTPVSVVYVHGFSASSEEIRPVPDDFAAGIGANLHFTRLMGHGRSGAAMGEATVEGWMRDVAEAIAVGREIGDEVVVMSTSTGGTLVAVAATNPAMMDKVKGLIFVSPNFGINNPAAPLLTIPAARQIVPLLVGAERSFEPDNEGHAKYWTTQYPTVATLPMAAIVAHAVTLNFGQVRLPALFYINDADRVVRPELTREIAAKWGGPAIVEAIKTKPGDDEDGHVIVGDLISPAQTAEATQFMLDWYSGL